MAGPTKEYRARIRVALTDELLPSPVLTKSELETMLRDALQAGRPDSAVVSVEVFDPK